MHYTFLTRPVFCEIQMLLHWSCTGCPIAISSWSVVLLQSGGRLFIPFHEAMGYENPWTIVSPLDNQVPSEGGCLVIEWRRVFSHSYFMERFRYWMRNCDFALHPHGPARRYSQHFISWNCSSYLISIAEIISWRPMAVEKHWTDLGSFVYLHSSFLRNILRTNWEIRW